MKELLAENGLRNDFVDDLLREDTPNVEESESENEHSINNSERSGSAAEIHPVTITHSIGISLTRTTTVMPNGNTEIERQTNVCFSENIDPSDVDMDTLIRDILSEIPIHFRNQRDRNVYGDFSQ
ncbi:uncharacterized protein LOC133176249 [Saccostrea echinata]|uniref:uncharacterized protein LOC133176249 n=1 Tax=Saccostrea echinata TaxID=191078 RepID=UPI002A83456A|nr:uncharacterized protein LOC133176249 [Saccostrea echinata]